MRNRITMTLLTGIVFFMAGAIGVAQQPDAGSRVVARGAAARAFEPNMVRVRFRVFASGKTAKSALTKLDADRKSLQTALDALKGDKPNVRLGDASQLPETAQSFQERAMQMAMAGGKKPDDDDKKRITRLGFQATLQWPLKGQTAIERLAEVDEIERQLRELDVIDRAGNDKDEDAHDGSDEKDEDERPARSPKDKESDGKSKEPAASKSRMRLDVKPTFDYIHQLSEEEVTALAKSAFTDAERSARIMAVASGRKLGPLQSLGNPLDAQGGGNFMEKYQSTMMEMFGGTAPTFDEDANVDALQVRSPQMGPIQMHYAMEATFQLQ